MFYFKSMEQKEDFRNKVTTKISKNKKIRATDNLYNSNFGILNYLQSQVANNKKKGV